MNLFEVFGQIALQGADAVNDALSGVNEQAESVAQAMDDFGQRTSAAGESLTKWVTGPIAAVATGLTALAVSTAEAGDEIAKNARIAGLSTDAYQELSFALGQISTITTEETTKAFQLLTKMIGDATAGNTQAIEKMQALGFSLTDIQSGTVTAESAFNALNTVMQGTSSEAQAAAVAAQFLEGAIAEKLATAMRSFGGDVDGLRGKFRELGLGMSEDALNASESFLDQLDIMQKQFTALTREIGAAFLPILMDMMAFISANVIPPLKVMANGLSSLFKALSALPEPIKTMIGVSIALVAALGPVLFIAGKIISLLAAFKAGIVAVVAAKALLVAGAGALASGLGAVVVAAAPFLAVVALIAAAVAGAVLVFQNWDRIVRAFGVVFNEISSMVSNGLNNLGGTVRNFASGVIETFRQLPQMVMRYINSMVNGVIQSVTNMVNRTISKLKSMYKEVVGNSIIPDMVRDVGAEMELMADQGAQQADRFNSGVQSGLSGITPPMATNGGSGGGNGAVNVDMRYAVIRDDKDMLERLMRSGAGVSGAFQ